MSKNVQIPEALFIDLVKLHLLDLGDDEIDARVRQGLQDKLAALVRRQLYTDSKTAESAELRELARQRYLDERGIPASFRWPEGQNPYK